MSSYKKLIGIILFLNYLFSLQAFSKDQNTQGNALSLKERAVYQISKKYNSGKFLIYNCKGRHFACVSKDNFETCKKERKEAFALKYDHTPCAPLKEFEKQTACFQKQLELIGQIPNKKFCINFERR